MPAGRPILCEYNRNKADIFVSGCCKDSDLCNERMNLTLAPLKQHRTAAKPQKTGKNGSVKPMEIRLELKTLNHQKIKQSIQKGWLINRKTEVIA